MTKVILFESSNILLTYLKISIQRFKDFQIAASCSSVEDLINQLKEVVPDVLLIGHQGTLEINTLFNLVEQFPQLDVIGVRFDEVRFKQCVTKSKTAKRNQITLDELLKPLQPIYLVASHNQMNKRCSLGL